MLEILGQQQFFQKQQEKKRQQIEQNGNFVEKVLNVLNWTDESSSHYDKS